MAPAVDVPEPIRQLVGGHPLVAERLFRNGLTDADAIRAFLDPAAYAPASPFELPDLETAAERLKAALGDREPILIWGDFDVDGQTATALLLSALRKRDADVHYHVPLRNGEGHGLNLPGVQNWVAKGIRLIITCDTGISSHHPIAAAQAAGVDCIVTDHHLLAESLPPAYAVVNPMRLPPGHPLREMPGVAVAHQLITAIAEGRESDDLLDLVALGIVADVAELKNDTRFLLQRGLTRFRMTERPGLRAMIELARINPLEVDESDLGFAIAPRLNAQGRLGDAAEAVELLSTLDAARAVELANQLEGMNAQRRLESSRVEASAKSLLDRDPSLLEYAAIVLSHPDWSGGVVGIVANRLAEMYHKPVVLLCEKEGRAFGSARSIMGLNITDALRACREKLTKFGGHAMAAGLGLPSENLYDFRRLLSRRVREMAPEREEEPVLDLDGELRLSEISIDLVRDFRRLAPFGNGNPPLTVAIRNLRLVRKKMLGRSGKHLELLVEDDGGARQRVQWWNAPDADSLPARLDLACQVQISKFGDAPEVVLELRDLIVREAGAIHVESGPAYQVEDVRDALDPRAKLAETLAARPDAMVWREAETGIAGCTRTELAPAETLIVWTPPPGPIEWQAALDRVTPQRIVVFGQSPAETSVDAFLKRLGGLIKFTINSRQGRVPLDALAAATAQRAGAVRYGLKWFEAAGQLGIDWLPRENVLLVQKSGEANPQDQAKIESLLRSVLAETAAYRKHWMEHEQPAN
jgi:single-stranded-DNA-specific exonuclease